MADSKKYYWLKLKRDFFKRHDIQIIESMPNGKEFVLFYVKLLAESVDHDGALRFSDEIPYSVEMLAAITHTDAGIAKTAFDLLTELKLITVSDDKTIYMNETSKMTGSAANNDNAKRQQRFRDKQKTVTKNNAGVTRNVTNNNESIEIRDKRLENRKKENIREKAETNNVFLRIGGET